MIPAGWFLIWHGPYSFKKRLRLHPYKTTAMGELKHGDSAKRAAYCKWILEFLDREGEDIFDVTFFTDEAYFHFSGYINSQISRFWCAHNPHAYRWMVFVLECRVGAQSDPFFSLRLSTPNDVVTILCIPSLRNLKNMKLTRPFFSRMGLQLIQRIMSMALFNDVFAGRIISTTIWPPRSPDLSPPDFFSLGCDEKLSVFQQSPYNWWFEDDHHRTHSAWGPWYTEHSLREHSSACQLMSGDWRGTLWTLLVAFCIVIIRCTETVWSLCVILSQ
jgi:hypothetical protein